MKHYGCLLRLSKIIYEKTFNTLNCINHQPYYISFNSYSSSNWGIKKKHRNIPLNQYYKEMADPKIEEILAPLRAHVKEQV